MFFACHDLGHGRDSSSGPEGKELENGRNRVRQLSNEKRDVRLGSATS